METLRYTMNGAAAALGISRKHLYTLMKRNLIQSYKDGAKRFIRAAELRRYEEEAATREEREITENEARWGEKARRLRQ